MLSLNNIALRRGRKVLIENATLQVHPGQRVGVIGANGCGKTSLFAMLMGELEPDQGELDLNPALELAHVAQESPDGSGPAVDYVMDGDRELRAVQAAIREGEASADRPDLHLLYERMEAIDGFTAEPRASRLLHGLGFAADEFTKPVNQFSGGWRMRLNLARALMCRSDLLLLDEPTNHLDLPALEQVEAALATFTGTVLLVSHDRRLLEAVTVTRPLRVDGGRLVEGV
jgi:ATP-binding cassette subfamily F protein 3